MRVRARAAVALVALLAIGACGDGPTAPRPMDAAAVARVLPVVQDARARLVAGIVAAPVRARVSDDLQEIELALIRNDARSARFRTRLLRSVLTDYASESGSLDRADAADVTALSLALVETAQLFEIVVDIPAIR
ncbi:MAG: hypothetical protein KF689_07960 [Gemmatimonadaceae bacterium]|nr:hypothetical protein [Gemmatimonadaceae bacterium]MCW5827466.1 hypothetical protein [Gemmatimonadaceae bacterium]